MSTEQPIENTQIKKTNSRISQYKQHTLAAFLEARFTINSFIIFSSLIGLMTTHVFSLSYNQILTAIYSGLLLLFYWAKRHDDDTVLFWHQVLHWAGMLIACIILTANVTSELINSPQAGQLLSVLLGFSLFLSGVYGDTSFMLSGLYVLSLNFIRVSFSPHSYQIYLISTACFLLLLFVIVIFTIKKSQHRY